mmetsp:Transcript_83910/g.227476  ORF Transcript_83910/g.227476 Transcript_83910/m.227476 type:complete len:227 (-) Transcript_83910:829-1509(-)
MLVPLAESSRDSSSTGRSGDSKRCSTEARSKAPPASTAAGMPSVARAACILKIRSCHCAKTTAFSPARRITSSCFTSAEIFDPNSPSRASSGPGQGAAAAQPPLPLPPALPQPPPQASAALPRAGASNGTMSSNESNALRSVGPHTGARQCGHSALDPMLRSMQALQNVWAQGVIRGAFIGCRQMPHSSSFSVSASRAAPSRKRADCSEEARSATASSSLLRCAAA